VPANPTRRIWWAIVGLMFLLNLMTLIGRDIQALRTVEALVEAHGQTAATARQLRARVVAEDRRRRGLVERRRGQDPLPMLAEATRLLPAEAWVQRLGWDGKRLRLAGYKASGVDVVAALRRSPLLADVRSAATDVPAQGTTQPFDVSADRRQ
jgi:Tfp pilus assembly protein PilN